MCHTGGKSGGRLQKIFLDPPPPELLVRSDFLTGLFPDALTKEDALQSGPDLGNQRWHYRVVDIKFTTPRAERPKSIGNLTLKNTVTWPYSRLTGLLARGRVGRYTAKWIGPDLRGKAL